MEYRENPMFGRRVFFLNPPLSVENSVIPVLKDQDYEVYIIREYACAKPVLRMYENAICFIFIDDDLSLDAWFNYIKSFESDPSLQSVFLGVLSIKTKPKDQERFLMNLKLPGGFVMLEKNMEPVTSNIEGILKINGAKGVRKCMRLELKDNSDVNGYFASGSMLYSFRLIDISALGFAAVVPLKMAQFFQKGKIISNVSITMGRFSFVCSVVIYNASIIKESCTVVMMLHPETSAQVKRKIHNFVFDTLEMRHRILLETIPRDMTDYNIRVRTDSESDAEAEEIETAEEVSEEKTEEANKEKKEGIEKDTKSEETKLEETEIKEAENKIEKDDTSDSTETEVSVDKNETANAEENENEKVDDSAENPS